MPIPRLQMFTALVCAWIGVACTDPAPAAAPDDLLQLRWTKAHDAESRAEVHTGLLWGLSFLGARLANTTADDVLVWDDNVVTLNIARAGVAPETLPAWRKLFAAIKGSEEYRLMGAVDIGRFVMLTLGSSKHYFALTGARRSYQESRAAYRFGERTGAIIESGIAREQRLIELADATHGGEIAFIAHEGKGSIPGGSFESLEFELLDVMPNGQLRIALYDRDGRLKDAADPELTAAGKPAKCLWCHEIRLLPAMNNHTESPGHYTTAEFDRQIAQRMALIEAWRAKLDSQIDFSHLQDHRYLEHLYLSFAEPTLARLAREWKVTSDEAARRLAGKRVIHGAGEFAFLGVERYSRDDADASAPYASLRVPASAREPSAYEPDLITGAHEAHRSTAPGNR